MAKTLTLLSLCWILSIMHVLCQGEGTDQVAQKEIRKLPFLTGEWKGSGWILMQDGERYNFDQTEHIQFKLGSTVMLIEGRGMVNGQFYHHALAIVSYNHEEDNCHYTHSKKPKFQYIQLLR